MFARVFWLLMGIRSSSCTIRRLWKMRFHASVISSDDLSTLAFPLSSRGGVLCSNGRLVKNIDIHALSASMSAGVQARTVLNPVSSCAFESTVLNSVSSVALVTKAKASAPNSSKSSFSICSGLLGRLSASSSSSECSAAPS